LGLPFALAHVQTLEADRIEMKVAAQGQRPFVPAHRHRFETALEQMAAAPVTPVKPDAVTDVQPLRRAAQVRFAQVQEQMIMVVPQHKTMQANAETQDHLGQAVQANAAGHGLAIPQGYPVSADGQLLNCKM
jgi:hypothetical protein